MQLSKLLISRITQLWLHQWRSQGEGTWVHVPPSQLEISICLRLLGASLPDPLEPAGGLPSSRPPLLSPVANSLATPLGYIPSFLILSYLWPPLYFVCNELASEWEGEDASLHLITTCVIFSQFTKWLNSSIWDVALVAFFFSTQVTYPNCPV